MLDSITIITANTAENKEVCQFDSSLIDYDKHKPNQPLEYVGKLKNLRIHQNVNRIKIHGSLAKFLHGENCTPLTFEQVKEAISLLEKELNLDLSGSKVTELEVGYSFEVKESVSSYLGLFLDVSKLQKGAYSTTLGSHSINYMTEKTQKPRFKGYDKIKEMKYTKTAIPEPYTVKNVLRLEATLKSKDLKKIKQKSFPTSFYLYDLKNETYYNRLKMYFYKQYERIPKIQGAVDLDKCIEQAYKEHLKNKKKHERKELAVKPVIELISSVYYHEKGQDLKTALQRAEKSGFITDDTKRAVLRRLKKKDIPASCLLTELNSKIEAICLKGGVHDF
jgi:hypothetical protein